MGRSRWLGRSAGPSPTATVEPATAEESVAGTAATVGSLGLGASNVYFGMSDGNGDRQQPAQADSSSHAPATHSAGVHKRFLPRTRSRAWLQPLRLIAMSRR